MNEKDLIAISMSSFQQLYDAVDPDDPSYQKWGEDFIRRWNLACEQGMVGLTQYLSPTELRGVLRYIPEMVSVSTQPTDLFYHLEGCVRLALRQKGGLAECGSFLGNTAKKILRWMQEAGGEDRTLHLFDTWAGLPVELVTERERKETRGPEWWTAVKEGQRVCSLGALMGENDCELLRNNLREFENFEVHKGLFSETLPAFDESLCFIFSDSDLEQSTVETIHLANRLLVSGGVIVFHDYDYPDFPGVTYVVDEKLDPERYYVVRPKKEPEGDGPAIAIAIKMR